MPSNTYNDSHTRWLAVSQRDASAAGHFVYSVKTTGIFCRPDCGSRLARRANVAFHDDAARALAAGFRPCRRCRPSTAVFDPQGEAVARACRAIAAAVAEGRPAVSLDGLARVAGLTKSHLHRVFKRRVGVTPRAYRLGLEAQREGEGRAEPLGRSGPLDPADDASPAAAFEPLLFPDPLVGPVGNGEGALFPLDESVFAEMLADVENEGLFQALDGRGELGPGVMGDEAWMWELGDENIYPWLEGTTLTA